MSRKSGLKIKREGTYESANTLNNWEQSIEVKYVTRNTAKEEGAIG